MATHSSICPIVSLFAGLAKASFPRCPLPTRSLAKASGQSQSTQGTAVGRPEGLVLPDPLGLQQVERLPHPGHTRTLDVLEESLSVNLSVSL